MWLALALVVSSAFGNDAPLFTQRETIDRVVGGVAERSFLVIFNERAPSFDFQDFAKIKSWLPTVMPEVNVANVQHVYNIGEGFRGFAVWANFDALESIRRYEGVRYIEEDQVVRAMAFTDRPDWGQVRVTQGRTKDLNTTNAAYNYSGTAYPNAGLDDSVWNWTQSVRNNYRFINNGNGAKIWIVDTGVLQNHSEFQDSTGKSRVSTSQDYVTPTTNGTDCHGHGTHCAGSAAGRFRGISVAADIGNVRVLNCQGSGTTANVVAGFNYVADNQDPTKDNILSASLGGGASQASDDAINGAAGKGVIPVVAAGNDNANACGYSPARANQAITVRATQSSDTRSTFSNFGPCVDVFSPGQSIHSAWIGANAVTYNTISGTSMATPLVAGAVGLYVTSETGKVDVVKVKGAITQFGTPGVVLNPGTGSPNVFINAAWN